MRLLLHLLCLAALSVVTGAVLTGTASAASRLPGAPPPAFDPAGSPVDAHTAYKLGGRRWPGRPARITYYNYAKGYARWVKDAVSAWNTSGAKVRFVAASKKRAMVTIKYSGLGCFGFAQLGYSGRRAAVVLGRGCDIGPMAQIAAHELGHIIGLNHENGTCAAMNSEVGSKCTSPPQPWQYRCRLLETDDIRGAVKRYGGAVKPQATEFCEQHPAPGPPAGLVAAAEGEGVRLSWRNVGSRSLASVVLHRRRDACPAGPEDPEAQAVYAEGEVKPGAASSQFDDSLSASGRYCYVAFSRDQFGRPGGGSAPAWVDYTAPPDPFSEEFCEDPDC